MESIVEALMIETDLTLYDVGINITTPRVINPNIQIYILFNVILFSGNEFEKRIRKIGRNVGPRIDNLVHVRYESVLCWKIQILAIKFVEIQTNAQSIEI